MTRVSGLLPMLPTSLLAAGTLAALMTAPVCVRAEGANGWKEHYDARLHVGIALPAGWTLKTEGYTLVAQSADHASLVLAEAFAAKPGESAQTYVHSLAARHASLFAHAQITKTAPQANAGDTLLAALSYKSAAGKAGQARALCSVFQNSGMLYAIAAPDAHFAQERSALLKSLQSLRFGPPPNESAPSAENPASRPAKGVAAGTVNGIKFVKWTDPKEHAYTIDVPEGWTVDGGTYRFESSEIRPVSRLTSPGSDMFLQVGDQGLPTFTLPTPQAMQTYRIPEGVLFSANHTYRNMLLRYMPPREFNKTYLAQTLQQGIDGFAITKEEELPDIAGKITADRNKSAQSNGTRLHFECSIAATEFKGVNKSTGKPILGRLVSMTQIITSEVVPGMPQWDAQPIVMLYADNEKAAAHLQMLKTIAQRLNESFQENPEWAQKQNQLVNRETARIAAQANQHVADIGKLSQQMAADSEARRKGSMNSYWNHVAAGNERQRQFLNHIGDQTDVRNSETGQAYKVGSGYSNYYHDPRTGTILGTNSTERPPVDFTPLEQF